MKYEHNHPHDHDHPPVSPRASINNWRESDLSFSKKLRLASRNLWVKVSKHQTCCGHPGEPGC
jgi:hypothetical protein